MTPASIARPPQQFCENGDAGGGPRRLAPGALRGKQVLLVYRGAVRFSGNRFDAATVMDTLFETNGWGRSWRDSVYDFVHYHSQVHEVLGVARGSAIVEFGGVKGRELHLKAGDVAVLPAGTGHRLIEASKNFLVVGAYPPTGLTTSVPTQENAPTRRAASREHGSQKLIQCLAGRVRLPRYG